MAHGEFIERQLNRYRTAFLPCAHSREPYGLRESTAANNLPQALVASLQFGGEQTQDIKNLLIELIERFTAAQKAEIKNTKR
jgi:hypothetical protein